MNRINFSIIVFLCFTFPALFGQKEIDYCKFLEQVLTEPDFTSYYDFPCFDTVYIYEDNPIKYFTNCDLSHIKTNRIIIVPNNSYVRYDTAYVVDSIYEDGVVRKYVSNIDSFYIKNKRCLLRTENPQIWLWQRNLVLGTSIVKMDEKNIVIYFCLGKDDNEIFPKKVLGLTYKKKRGKYVLIGFGIG